MLYAKKSSFLVDFFASFRNLQMCNGVLQAKCTKAFQKKSLLEKFGITYGFSERSTAFWNHQIFNSVSETLLLWYTTANSPNSCTLVSYEEKFREQNSNF